MAWTSVDSYLRRLESVQRRELVWGVVREPPAPFYDHQHMVTRLTVLLTSHADAAGAGQVCVSPISSTGRSGDRRISWSKFSLLARHDGIARQSLAGISATACASTGSWTRGR